MAAASRAVATGVRAASTRIRATASRCRAMRNAAGSPSGCIATGTNRVGHHARREYNARGDRRVSVLVAIDRSGAKAIVPSVHARIALPVIDHSDRRAIVRRATVRSSPRGIVRTGRRGIDRKVIVRFGPKEIARAEIVPKAAAASHREAGPESRRSPEGAEAEEDAGRDDRARRVIPTTRRSGY